MATAIESPAEAVKAAIAANNSRFRSPGDHDRMKEALPPVFVFSVSPFAYRVPLGSHGLFLIPACEPGMKFAGPVGHAGKPYITGVLPLDYDQGDANGRMGIFHDYGADVAKDVVGIGSSSHACGTGTTNREHWGVFISETATRENPMPSDAEIAAANARLTKMALLWFEEGQRLDKEGNRKAIGPTHRWAAAHCNQKVDWAAKSIPMENCPVCQEPVKPGTIKHTCQAILDWEGALKHGLVTRQQYDDATGAAAKPDAPSPAPSPAPARGPIAGQPIRQAK